MKNRNSIRTELQKVAEVRMAEELETVRQTFENYLKRLENSLSYGKIEQQLALCGVLINMRPTYLELL